VAGAPFDLGAFALIALFFIAFFWRALIYGQVLCHSDAFIYSYPLRNARLAAMRRDTFRFGRRRSCPAIRCFRWPRSHRLSANLVFIYFCRDDLPKRIYDLAPYLLFPFFIYCYLREVGRSRLASILAGLAFGYGGFLISPVAYNGLLGNALMWFAADIDCASSEPARGRLFAVC